MNWFWDILRKILIGIDFVVYGLVEQVLQTIVDLSNVQIFTDVAINEFSRRIYIILGLVMVFKVMMSFIQILINPDSMSDKEKGAGNILKRVVIALALIVFVPSIFKMARDVQGYVLPIIPKVILGIESSDTATDPISQSNIGSAMAWYSFLPFFDYANETCDTGTIQKIVSNDTTDYEINSVGAALNHITDKDACNNGGYKYTHKYLVSTLVGAYLLFSLVQIAIQIAIRALKLGICEFVAPIPIASYIDPKTSKSTFDKWVSTSIKVYLDLFIQLIAVYFVVFVFITIFDNASISSIVSSAGNNWWRASLIVLFIIVGLLKFVKEFPKFLSGLLGIKTDGAIGSIFKNAWDSRHLATVGFKGARDSIRASREAKENASLSALRGVNGFLGAYGKTVGTALRGKSIKESTASALDKIHASNKNSIAGSRAFAKNGHVGIGSVASLHKQQFQDNRRAKMGLPSMKSGLDYSVGNLQSITDTVENSLKATGGNKVAKYWANRYEAAKNVGIEVFEEEVMAPDKQRLSEISSEYTKRGLTKERKHALEAESRAIQARLANKTAIRDEAQRRQAEYVNRAEKDLSDAKTRLLEFAATHNESVLTAEDIKGSGLGSAEAVYDDGGILGRINSNLNSFAAGINDKVRDDEKLRAFLPSGLDFSTMTGKQMKDLRDNANTEANNIRTSGEYYQKQFTEQHTEKK